MRQIKDFFLIIITIIAIFSIFNGLYLLFFASFVTVFLVFMARLWNKYVFSRLDIERKVSRKRASIGDKLYYQVKVENRKLLPVLGIEIKDKVTEGIDFVNKKFSHQVPGNNFDIFHDFFSLKWYEKVKRSYDMVPTRRGYYRFGDGNIFYSGIFGLYKNQLYDKRSAELIVYPRIIPAKSINIDLKQLFGSSQSEGWIHKDRLNKVGVRPYQSTDNMKRINWKASARHNQLESDIYKPSYDREVHIFLSTLTTENWWQGIDRNRMELSVIYAASICNHALDRGYQVGLYSDGLVKRSGSFMEVNPGKSNAHKQKLLSNLAMLQPADRLKFADILYKKKKSIKSGSTVIVILSVIFPEIEKMINQLRKYYNLKVIVLGDSYLEMAKLKGVNVYKVDEEEEWDEIEKVGLV